MGLWKETFHDSDAYVRLIFDAYFDMDHIEFEEKDGHIIASLMGIPYAFGNENLCINGVYLCGLATKKSERGRGIMTELLQRMEIKMRQKGESFLFLIPADEGLRRYYRDRGFVNGFYKREQYYTAIHDFRADWFSARKSEKPMVAKLKIDYYEGLKTEVLRGLESLEKCLKVHDIVGFIYETEGSQKGFSIYQNRLQIEVFLREMMISGGKIYVCFASGGNIAGVSLVEVSDESIAEKGRYVESEAALFRLREAVVSDNEGKRFVVNEYGAGDSTCENLSTWQPAFASVLPEAPQVGAIATGERVYNPNEHLKVYGMVKILSVSEILKFVSDRRRDLKYSILTQQGKSEKSLNIVAKMGKSASGRQCPGKTTLYIKRRSWVRFSFGVREEIAWLRRHSDFRQ